MSVDRGRHGRMTVTPLWRTILLVVGLLLLSSLMIVHGESVEEVDGIVIHHRHRHHHRHLHHLRQQAQEAAEQEDELDEQEKELITPILLDLSSHAHSTAHVSEGDDWSEKPVWWNDPGEENVKPWQEDNYGYLFKHHADPNSNMSPDPYPSLAAGRFQTSAAQSRFALHRVLNTPTVAGAPASVHAYQFPGAPPLPELDATMQPTNNYPNAPFYEYDYNKDYIWG